MKEKNGNTHSQLIRLSKASFIFAVIAFLLSIADLGFRFGTQTNEVFIFIYHLTFLIFFASQVLRLHQKRQVMHKKIVGIDIFLSIFILLVFLQNAVLLFLKGSDALQNGWSFLAIFFIFIRESYNINFRFKYKAVNPAQLFIASFFLIILMGSLLLMLPNATRGEIRYVDALFTATSAVCVTGLSSVDTGEVFTLLGQTIILFLIQIGGLGIMTFVSYFSFFFKSNASCENQMYMGEMTNIDKLDNVFNVLKKIILVTFSIEFIGAILLFSGLSKDVVSGVGNRIYFSVFHAVSAFCNAGFSPLKYNLYEDTFRYNYYFQTVVAFLIIFGGLGFPIIFNSWKFIVYKFSNWVKRIFKKREKVYQPWVLNLNSKIIISTTLILLVSGTLLFLLFEYNNTLAEHKSFIGKLAVSFFGSVTTRTAGFQSVDTGAMTLPTTLFFLIFMWIGASPASTGGGVKTSTFAIALANIISIAKGKKNLEIFNREISQGSVNKSFAIITLSIFVIFINTLIIALTDPKLNLLSVLFEVVSAYGTVGLSRGITASLSDAAKVIIAITMFLGRVGTLSLIVALVKKVNKANYRYPSEDILIN